MVVLLGINSVLAATVSVRISSADDDAEQRVSDGDMYMDSSDLELGYDDFRGSLQIIGMRFTGVAIPQGATINSKNGLGRLGVLHDSIHSASDARKTIHFAGALLG